MLWLIYTLDLPGEMEEYDEGEFEHSDYHDHDEGTDEENLREEDIYLDLNLIISRTVPLL